MHPSLFLWKTEVDESMFGHKHKYNHGRISKGSWVFSMVERGSGWALTFHVPDVCMFAQEK